MKETSKRKRAMKMIRELRKLEYRIEPIAVQFIQPKGLGGFSTL